MGGEAASEVGARGQAGADASDRTARLSQVVPRCVRSRPDVLTQSIPLSNARRTLHSFLSSLEVHRAELRSPVRSAVAGTRRPWRRRIHLHSARKFPPFPLSLRAWLSIARRDAFLIFRFPLFFFLYFCWARVW
jgi:hypothetical protein